MTFTVRTALETGGLKTATLLAGSGGLDRPLESVSVLEVCETKVTNWVVENEMYITSFYSVLDDIEAQKQLITSLHKYGCCALVVCHVGMFLESVDPSLIELCDELGLVLIKAEPSVSYAQIMRPIIQQLMQKGKKRRQDEHDKIRDIFIEHLAGGQNLETAFSVITSRANLLVSYYDSACHCLYSNKDASKLRREKEFLQAHHSVIPENTKDSGYWVAQIDSDECLVYGIYDRELSIGFLCITIQPGTDFSDIVNIGDALSSVCTLLIFMQSKRHDVRERILLKYLEDLFFWNFDNDQDAIRKGKDFGIILEGKKQLVTILLASSGSQELSPDPPPLLVSSCGHASITNALVPLVSSFDERSEVLPFGEELIVLLHEPFDHRELERMTEELNDLLSKKHSIAFSAGISNLFGKLSGIKEAYQQARQTALIGRILQGNNKLFTYHQLYFSHKLLEMARDKEVLAYCQQLFQPLIEYDEDNHSNLMETLTLLLRNDLNTSQVAKLLYLHRNSILNRKNKIIEIYGYSPFESTNHLNFFTALLIVTLSQALDEDFH